VHLSVTRFRHIEALCQAPLTKHCLCQYSVTCLCCGCQGPVFMYYSLTNYYQNHRRYVKSRDDYQLRGEDVGYSALQSSDCWPFVGNSSSSKAYAPCGAIANSMFNGMIILANASGQSSLAKAASIRWEMVLLSDAVFRGSTGVFAPSRTPIHSSKPCEAP